MSPNLGLPHWKRIASRVVFYAVVMGVLQMLDASSSAYRLHRDNPALWSDEELGVAPAYFGTAPPEKIEAPRS